MKSNKILLHTCCAPCLVYVHEKLNEMNVDYDSYFYNPNIHPIKEHERRLLTLRSYMSRFNIPLIEDDEFLQHLWEEGFQCKDCYSIRLDKTAKYAKDNGYKGFSTTLLINIYQNHQLILRNYLITNRYFVIICFIHLMINDHQCIMTNQYLCTNYFSF